MSHSKPFCRQMQFDVSCESDQMQEVCWYLEADELLLPRVETRQVDLAQGFMTQLQVNSIRRDSKLKGHSLMSFCHVDWGTGTPQANKTLSWGKKAEELKK